MAKADRVEEATEAGGLIVDCDVHADYLTPKTRELIADRLEEPFRSHLLRETGDYGPYPRDAFPKEPIESSGPTSTYKYDTSSPEQITEDLIDGMAIDVAILNSLQKLDLVPNPERAVREMRVINDFFIEHFLDGHDQFYGLAMLTTQRPDVAAEELDRLADDDSIVGALLLNGASDMPLGDPRYDTIYRAAQDHGLPVVFHSSTIGYTLNKRFSFLYDDLNTYSSVHTLAHPFANMTTLTSLMMNGVPAKFPELEFVFLEQDLGLVPFMTYRMNREVHEHAHDTPLLEETPEDYIRDRFYWGTQPLPEPQRLEHARHIIDMVGPENILFATDHPHPDFDSPSAVMDSYFGHLSNEDRTKVLGGNAAEVFGINP